MNTAYLDMIANHAAGQITHIALFDDTGSEISGGSYARQAVTWTAASSGEISPDSDLQFDIPAGATVAEWRGFDASTGGTDYGGASLTNESFAEAGTYTLLAASTSINHSAA